MNWKEVKKPMGEGGLGIRSLVEMSRVLWQVVVEII